MLQGGDEHVNLQEQSKCKKITSATNEKEFFSLREDLYFLSTVTSNTWHVAVYSDFITRLPRTRSSLFRIPWVIATKLMLFVLIKILLGTLYTLFCFRCRLSPPPAILLIFIGILAMLEMDWCDSIHWYLLKCKLPHNNYWWEGAWFWSCKLQQKRDCNKTEIGFT